MLRGLRRLWLALACGAIAVPLVVGLLAPASMTSQEEFRGLAPAPGLPATRAAWLALPSGMSDYLADHFGLRRIMIHAQSVIAHLWLRGGTDRVLVGRDGWLFFRGDSLVEQSTGRLVREQPIVETADTIARAQQLLARRGVKFVFASPPNSATIYDDMLPRWAGRIAGPTEYDLMLKALAERGVNAVDLRPVLRQAAAGGAVYFQHDTHWTARGGLAAFNAITAAVGDESWRLDPAKALGPPALIADGDLARMLGLASDLHERTQYLTLPDFPKQSFVPPPLYTFAASSSRVDGPTVLIVGDSFAERWFIPMVLTQARRVVLTHIGGCGFDWSWIDRFKPDQVWWMPNERAFLCWTGTRPKGMPP